MAAEKHESDRLRMAEQALASVPPEVCQVLDRLRHSGGRAWLVGGTVRDLLRGLDPDDFDVATDLHPDVVAGLFDGADLRDRALGAVRVEGLPCELVVTTLRGEAEYRDHRRPERIWFVDDLAVDARRRDFTCNAIYLDPVRRELVDPTGGMVDLAARVVRAIGDPGLRFREDALRLLRAWRFTAALGGAMEPRTAAAAAEQAGLLRHLSGPRVFEELTRAFTGCNRGAALRQLVELGFACVVLPEVVPMDGVPQPPQYHPEGDVLTHVCLVLDHVPVDSPTLSWAAVLHDVGKPPTFTRGPDRIRFDGHDTLSARMADDVLRRLGAGRELRETVVEVCRDHIKIASLMQMRPRRRERWLRSPRFPEHLAFHRADCLASHGDLSIFETASAALSALPPELPVVLTGADVLGLGVAQGPLVGRLLGLAEAELDEQGGRAGDAAVDRARALEILRQLVARHVKPQG